MDEYQDACRQLAEATISLPNSEAWKAITEAVRRIAPDLGGEFGLSFVRRDLRADAWTVRTRLRSGDGGDGR